MLQTAYRLLDEALALMAQHRRGEALSRFESALSAAVSPEARAIVARNAGMAYEQCQQLKEAIRCFEIAVANDPQDGRTYLVLASLEQQQGNLDVARGHLWRAKQIAIETDDEELRTFIKRSELSGGDDAS